MKYVVRGSNHKMAKFKEEDITSIRTRAKTGTISQGQLATEYHVSILTIFNIVHRKTWKHVKP